MRHFGFLLSWSPQLVSILAGALGGILSLHLLPEPAILSVLFLSTLLLLVLVLGMALRKKAPIVLLGLVQAVVLVGVAGSSLRRCEGVSFVRRVCVDGYCVSAYRVSRPFPSGYSDSIVVRESMRIFEAERWTLRGFSGLTAEVVDGRIVVSTLVGLIVLRVDSFGRLVVVKQ